MKMSAPALSGFSRHANSKKLTLQKQLRIITPLNRQCAIELKSWGNYGSLATPSRNAIWLADWSGTHDFGRTEGNMDTTTLLIIILLVLLLGGGGWYGRGRWY
jgi:hypothetical protein